MSCESGTKSSVTCLSQMHSDRRRWNFPIVDWATELLRPCPPFSEVTSAYRWSLSRPADFERRSAGLVSNSMASKVLERSL